MKTVEWNINNYVTVELCYYGIEIYKKYLTDLYIVVKPNGNVANGVNQRISELEDNGNKLRLQGWDMINIFGSHLRLGSQPIFKECVWNVEVKE